MLIILLIITHIENHFKRIHMISIYIFKNYFPNFSILFHIVINNVQEESLLYYGLLFLKVIYIHLN